jgi:hypothetical protein
MPACTAWWTSRGFDSAPWRWDAFSNTTWNNAHEWPAIVANLRATGFANVPRPSDRVNLAPVYNGLHDAGLLSDVAKQNTRRMLQAGGDEGWMNE